jgi:hypothetical protein
MAILADDDLVSLQIIPAATSAIAPGGGGILVKSGAQAS